MSQDYNKTLNLPKTDFPMRAGLTAKEPEHLKKWEEIDLYNKIIQKNEDKPLFVLHDGPPYANGDIHLGTALNKCLKDFIVRYKNMAGFKSPYVPGWDTHGLPTELKARKKSGIQSGETIEPVELRRICKEVALDYLDEQRVQFKRLGGIGEWDNPYITLLPEFESKQIEVFRDMACKGLIYKGLKPVYWCPDCVTALAEAEIEYSEDPCASVYVKFKLKDDKGKLAQFDIDLDDTYFVIWTTTAWTLPGNVAVCLGPDFAYDVVRVGQQYYIMAEDLVASVMKAKGVEEYDIVGKSTGKNLEGLICEHPFLDRDSLVIVGDHVTLESGTGCVHTAPGHGVEDYMVCQNYPELDILVPVDDKGIMKIEAGKSAGLTTEQANKVIIEEMKELNMLFAEEDIIHQYPHCWRCKQPVLFRATNQWFCSVDDFKEDAVKAADGVVWHPSWGKERMKSMIRERADWCISRQRKWGVPIPIFYCKACEKEIIDYDVITGVAELFAAEGSDIWYRSSAKEMLPHDYSCPHCGAQEFDKENDIMDVWFDAGSSHAAVLQVRDYLKFPADIYLEGADQFRGWFQSSLLTSVATKGVAPFEGVITHGWVVDGEGKKMSKSIGNGIEASEIIEQYGADILRLWVASSDYHADIRISKDILKQLSESYRKIRNTARFILGNLKDFDPDKDMVSEDKYTSIDRWAIMRLDDLIKKVKSAYDEYEYHIVFHSIHNFCVVDMSNFYLDVLKDRLYVESADTDTRRAAQTVIYKVLDAMALLMSPILPFTCDEIWDYMPHDKSRNELSPALNDMPSPIGLGESEDFLSGWERVHQVREDVKKALELARTSKIIGSSLDAKVYLFSDGELFEFLKSVESDLPDALIVSQAFVEKGEGEFKGEIEGLSVTVQHADGEKCERCWSYRESVGENSKHPTLCKRCSDILAIDD